MNKTLEPTTHNTSVEERWDYRKVLRTDLNARRRSMTSFAKDIGVSPAFLSQVLRRHRGLSEARATAIAAALGFDESKSHYFRLMVRYGNVEAGALRQELAKELAELDEEFATTEHVDSDVFAAISAWQHSAIIELAGIASFEPTPSWIAERLGIQPLEAEMALQRLLRLGLLKKSGNTLIPSSRSIAAGNVPSKAVRHHHQQMMQLATKAIENQSFEQREMRGKTFAVDQSQLPELRRMIDRFLRSVSLRPRDKDPDAVYQLSVQLFRLDR